MARFFDFYFLGFRCFEIAKKREPVTQGRHGGARAGTDPVYPMMFPVPCGSAGPKLRAGFIEAPVIVTPNK